jgi:predicted transcriptional regulator
VKSAAPAPKEKPEGLSQEEMARHVGCAQSTVSRAIARGDVSTLSNGRLPLSAVEALKALRAEDEKASSITADLERRKLAAETAEREAKAALRALELERERGDFVRLADVRRDGADCGERVVGTLRAIPQRTALAIEAALADKQQLRAAAVERLVSAEVERALGELRESLYVAAPAPGEFGAAGVCAFLASLAWLLWARSGAC